MKSGEAAAELRDLVEQLQPAFDILPDPIRVIDPRGISIYVNRAFLQMTGFSPTEIIGRPAVESFVEEDHTRVKTSISSFFKSGVWSGTLEVRMHRKGGEPVAVSLNGSAVRNSRQEMIGGFAVFRDVSRLERILAEPLEILKLEGSPVEVLRLLPARVAGYFPGRPWVMINLVQGEYLRFAYAINVPAELMAQGGEPMDEAICSIPIRSATPLGIADMTADDRTRQDPCVTQYGCRGYLGYPIRLSSGMVVGVICVLRSNRGGFGEYDHRILEMFAKRAAMELERSELEARLDEAERDLQGMIDHAPFLLWRISPEGRIFAMSRKGKKDLGYEESAAIGESWFDLIHPDDLDDIRKGFAQLQNPKTRNGNPAHQFRLRKKDGEYGLFFTTVRPVLDRLGNVKILEGVSIEIPQEESVN